MNASFMARPSWQEELVQEKAAYLSLRNSLQQEYNITRYSMNGGKMRKIADIAQDKKYLHSQYTHVQQQPAPNTPKNVVHSPQRQDIVKVEYNKNRKHANAYATQIREQNKKFVKKDSTLVKPASSSCKKPNPPLNNTVPCCKK